LTQRGVQPTGQSDDALLPGADVVNPSGGAETLLGGRYRLTERIARGGMGEVWRATDELLSRPVAVKLLREDLAVDPGFLGRFRAEARNTAMLSHPGIAAVHDYGEQGGYAYLVMELIPGEPLSWILSREATLDPDRALRYAGQAALALQAAHDAGVVHRDIKPPNLIITPGDQVKVTDFGVARAVGDQSLTGTGTVMGTAEYLSPEQASGREATAASDLYALGIVLYESLAGRRPFQGGNPVTVAMAQVTETPPVLPSSVSADVSDLVYRLLAKDPLQRPASAGALAREIAHVRSTLPAAGGDGADRGHESTSAAAPLAAGDALPTGSTTASAAGAPLVAVPHQSGGPVTRRLGANTPASIEVPADTGSLGSPDSKPASASAPAPPGPAVPAPDGVPGTGRHSRAAAQTATETASDTTTIGERADLQGVGRASILDGLTAHPTGRRRAPRRSAVDLKRVLAALPPRTRLTILAAGIGFAVVAAIAAVLTRGGASATVTVPPVVGEDVAAATADLGAAGLRPFVVRTSSSTVEVDIVIQQTPGPGVTAERGSVVQIVASAGRMDALGGPADGQPAGAGLALGRGRFAAKSDSGSIAAPRPGTVSGVTSSAEMDPISMINLADGAPRGSQILASEGRTTAPATATNRQRKGKD
jgi:eukaryotic-like serine/threonine-protein kinase